MEHNHHLHCTNDQRRTLQNTQLGRQLAQYLLMVLDYALQLGQNLANCLAKTMDISKPMALSWGSTMGKMRWTAQSSAKQMDISNPMALSSGWTMGKMRWTAQSLAQPMDISKPTALSLGMSRDELMQMVFGYVSPLVQNCVTDEGLAYWRVQR